MKKKRLLSLFLCIVMLMSTLLMFGADATTLQEDIAAKNQLESQLKALEEERKQIADRLAAARADEAKAQEEINLLYDEISTYQQQLETQSALIAEYTALAQTKEEEINALNVQMNRNYDLFKERLIFAQESGSMSYIDFVLGSSDLSDIISRSEVISDMLEYDRKIMESLLSNKKSVEKAKQEIEIALANCESKQAEYQNTLQIMEEKRAELAKRLEELKDNRQVQESAMNRANATKKEIEDRVDKLVQEITSKTQSSYNGTFCWPLPATNPGYFSRGFVEGYHTGLDIHVGGWVNNGKVPALSIAAGTVIRCGSYWDWGNLVVVDHGGGFVSYYAHLDSFSVSYGQHVSQGQQVGKIGSTGDSTGPHLHLTLYAPTESGSKRVDPMKYLPNPW